ncbi:hypothetical protein [Laribacter hongkongensis]|uniref:hypothetical protein n=1 Tax=Laribacter hongkongensis TaxID=168471 RepID=UPI001EFC85AE|nr:hypothetical protein [Laribacter hongkongensis]MCG9040009.1 hypothetical protein [Laribacter hongkongensis]MCG9068316.1 hypothetical protein [Laribacter hongkongensis]
MPWPGCADCPAFRPPPQWGDARGQQVELNRLRTLAEAGLPVPAIHHIAADWFAMQRVGQHSLESMLQHGPLPADTYWREGLGLLHAVHRQDQYLSQAFARNLIWHDDRLYLIDFDDDPAERLTVPQAQARDWLLYLLSCARHLSQPPQQTARQLHDMLATEPSSVRTALHAVARRLAWLRWLPSQRRPWGRDIVELQAAGAVLHELEQIMHSG